MGAPLTRRPAPRLDPAVLRFFAPERPDDLGAALAAAEPAADAVDTWLRGGAGERGSWSILRLPEPIPHPAAGALVAGAVGIGADALRALLDGAVYVDDAGRLRLWPWYPEEEAEARPIAERAAARLAVGLPDRHLDDPWEPAWYLRRTGAAALDLLLEPHGIAVPRVERVPIPPLAALPEVRFEGGGRAPPPERQAAAELIREVDRIRVLDDAGSRGRGILRVERALAALCAALGGPPLPEPEPDDTRLATPVADIAPGRVVGLCGVDDGVVLGAGEACVHVGADGQRRSVFPGRLAFAAGRAAAVQVDEGLAIRDLAEGRWREGTVGEHLHRFGAGLVRLPSGAGFDARTTPEISACGRYLLDIDETPTIVRLADQVVVACPFRPADDLDAPLDEAPRRRRRGLLRPEDLSVGAVTDIDGVRFTVRSGAPAVTQGRALALALCGDRWRLATGDRVREGRRDLVRAGFSVQRAAFDAEGRTVWWLSEDHLIRADLDPPRVVWVAALAPLLGGPR